MSSKAVAAKENIERVAVVAVVIKVVVVLRVAMARERDEGKVKVVVAAVETSHHRKVAELSPGEVKGIRAHPREKLLRICMDMSCLSQIMSQHQALVERGGSMAPIPPLKILFG